MKVIKIGGSLEKTGCLVDCLKRLASAAQGDLVIVPGGGIFADQVRMAQRRWYFDDVCAHHMAVLAMQQMALLLRSLEQHLKLASSIADIRKNLKSGQNVVWQPSISDLNEADIEASWNVTSDSLAAWLATELDADELILIKSADVPADLDVNALIEQGIVDSAFGRFTENAAYKLSIINSYGRQ